MRQMSSRSNKFVLAAATGAIPTLTLCWFSTLTIYAGNSAEFSVSLVDLLLAYLPYMLVLVGAFGVVGSLLSDNGINRYLAVVSAIAVLFWLQGNILVWDYGVLDGREIDWLSGLWRGVLDLSIWIVVLLLALTAYSRFGKTFMIAAIATLAIQVAAAAVTLLTSPAGILTRDSIEVSRDGRDELFRFSKDRNVVHIIMDGFQSDIFAEIINNPSNADLKQGLQGFTLFQDHMGVYPYTQLTVPALLSGKLYRNEIPVDDFVTNTLRGNTILNAAYDSGYEIDIAAPVGLKNVYVQGRHTNAYGITSSGHATKSDYIQNDSAKLLDLALFRVVPHFGKALVYRDELWVFQAAIRLDAYLQMQYFSDLKFLHDLATDMTVDRKRPVYKLIHVMLSHRPTVGNEQCEYDGKKPISRETVTTQARCGLMRVVDVLRRMQQLGVYDDSLIVLMGDHGAWVPAELRKDAAADRSPGEPLVGPTMVAMAIPMLAVKPPHSSKSLQFSTAPTSIIDVPVTIAEILGLDADFEGLSVFSNDLRAPRERYHFVYGYGDNPDNAGYLFPMREYVVTGSPFDAKAWRLGKRYLPGGVVSID
jgi:hypothetical protein